MDGEYLAELESHLNDFLNFQQAIDDLSALSLHFPMGLCRTKNAEDIMREGDEMRQKRPESFMNETYGDSSLKKRIMKNYGFIGLWYSMQKTFCGVEPSNNQQQQKPSSIFSTQKTTTTRTTTTTTTTKFTSTSPRLNDSSNI